MQEPNRSESLDCLKGTLFPISSSTDLCPGALNGLTKFYSSPFEATLNYNKNSKMLTHHHCRNARSSYYELLIPNIVTSEHRKMRCNCASNNDRRTIGSRVSSRVRRSKWQVVYQRGKQCIKMRIISLPLSVNKEKASW